MLSSLLLTAALAAPQSPLALAPQNRRGQTPQTPFAAPQGQNAGLLALSQRMPRLMFSPYYPGAPGVGAPQPQPTIANSTGPTLGNATPAVLPVPAGFGNNPGQQNQVTIEKKRWPAPGNSGLYELRITGLPSGFVERFLLQVPAGPTDVDVPLVVAYHAFGVSMFDITVNTTIPAETDSRGWYMLAPLGTADITFSSLTSQFHTELLIDLVCQNFNIDTSRIYGIGFSMGGGNALNYAARHVDPDKPMFAALVNHTGICSQRHSYEYDCLHDTIIDCPTQNAWEFWYGGPPDTFGFMYARSSVIDMNVLTTVIDPDTDFARNLLHVPINSWLATQDPLTELIEQNFRFVTWFATKGGSIILNPILNANHEWATLDVASSFLWLENQALSLPTSADTLADQDGKWFWFDLVQDAGGDFSRFSWAVDNFLNQLTIDTTANVSELQAHVVDAGLDTAQVFRLALGPTEDGTTDSIVLLDYPNAPSQVTRDGLVDTSWVHDPVEGTLTISELDWSATHDWVVNP